MLIKTKKYIRKIKSHIYLISIFRKTKHIRTTNNHDYASYFLLYFLKH